MDTSPFYDSTGEFPDVLRAWELEPSFRCCITRAAVGIERHGEEDIATIRNNANQLIKPLDTPRSTRTSIPGSLSNGSSSGLSAPSTHPLCPLRPCHLMKTHIQLALSEEWPLDQLLDTVHAALPSFSQYDFSFDADQFVWNGKYLQGSQFCVIRLQLYCELNRPSSYIIEAHRTSGDAKPFYDFFREFKHSLYDYGACAQQKGNTPVLRCQRELLHSLPANPVVLSPSDFLENVQPILSMAKSQYFEAKLEAARMLCDLSMSDTCVLGDPRCLAPLIDTLEQLVVHEFFPLVREQAIISLGAFVEVPGYGSLLARSEALSTLLALVGNPPSDEQAFDSAQLRRESARIVCASATSDPTGTSETLRLQCFPLRRWMEDVDEIRDPRLRKHGQQIKLLLENSV